jgi:hypothetical protein
VHPKPSRDRTVSPPIIPGAIVLVLAAEFGGAGTLTRAAGETPLRHPTPLTRITLSTDIDAPLDAEDPGSGGSFDNSAYFQNKLADVSQIRACVADVRAAASTWAKGVGLTPAFEEVKSASLSIHYVKPSLQGLFAVGVARVWWTPLKLIFEVSDAPLPNRVSAGVPATDGRSGAIWTHARGVGG